MLAKVRQMVLPAIERHGAIVAWVIDDTGFADDLKTSYGRDLYRELNDE